MFLRLLDDWARTWRQLREAWDYATSPMPSEVRRKLKAAEAEIPEQVKVVAQRAAPQDIAPIASVDGEVEINSRCGLVLVDIKIRVTTPAGSAGLLAECFENPNPVLSESCSQQIVEVSNLCCAVAALQKKDKNFNMKLSEIIRRKQEQSQQEFNES